MLLSCDMDTIFEGTRFTNEDSVSKRRKIRQPQLISPEDNDAPSIAHEMRIKTTIKLILPRLRQCTRLAEKNSYFRQYEHNEDLN